MTETSPQHEYRPLSRRAREAADGMDITTLRLHALRAVDEGIVRFNVQTSDWLVHGQVMRESDKRTYGELRRGNLIVEGRAEAGTVPVKLTAAGRVIVDECADQP